MEEKIIVPNLFDKDGNQIPRTDYLDENGYVTACSLTNVVDNRIIPKEFYDEQGNPIDVERFYDEYSKKSLSNFYLWVDDDYYVDPERIINFKKSSVVQKTIHTQRYFENQIDITDPCYPNDADHMELRLALPIKAGTYDCVTWKHVEAEDRNDGRTMIIGIYLNGSEPNIENLEGVGSVCVDTGSAGFFMNKPNYTHEEWERHVRSDFECIPGCYDLPWPELMGKIIDAKLQAPDVHITPEGFYSDIGWGDGEYNVLGYKENGEYVAFEIIG